MTNLLTQRQGIFKYCSGAKEISIGVKVGSDRKFKRYIKSLETFDLSETEIYRSISYINGDVLFCLDLDDHSDWRTNPFELLQRLLESARKVETVYPGVFHWRFTGRGMHANAIISFQDSKNVGVMSRYGTVYNFYKAVKNHLNGLINFGKYVPVSASDATFIAERGLNRSTGSHNIKTSMFCIPVNLKWTPTQILNKSKHCIIEDFELPTLNLRDWTRRVNPDMIDFCSVPKIRNPMKIDWDRYPICVKRMAKLRTKGCVIRWDLMRYWLWLHSVLDTKFLYDTVLNQDSDTRERAKVKYGNDKFEFRNAVVNSQAPPTCNTSNFKKHCSKKCNLNSPYEMFGINIYHGLEETKNESDRDK